MHVHVELCIRRTLASVDSSVIVVCHGGVPVFVSVIIAIVVLPLTPGR